MSEKKQKSRGSRKGEVDRQNVINNYKEKYSFDECKDCKYTWLSFSVRYKINIADLNNVEGAGNYVRMRKVPVIIKTNGGYTVVLAPAVSGEMIAHGYQSTIVDLAQSQSNQQASNQQPQFPLDKFDKQKFFLKHGIDDAYEDDPCKDKEDVLEYEMCVVKNSVVQDITGFMNPNKLTRRVSNVAFSFLSPPPEEVASKIIVAPQFQTRYTPKEYIEYQQPYIVEVTSGVFTLTGYLDVNGIGATQNETRLCVNNRSERIKLAIEALSQTLVHLNFGAKKTRFFPKVEIESLCVSLSTFLFNLPETTEPIQDNLKKSYKLLKTNAELLNLGNNNYKMICYVSNTNSPKSSGQPSEQNEDIKYVNNPIEVFKEVLGYVTCSNTQKLGSTTQAQGGQGSS